MLWFHNQLDAIYAPAHAVAESLVSRGLDPAVIRVYPRGVDHERFMPGKRSEALRRELGAAGSDTVLLLYSGRIAERKGLSRLAGAYRRLAETGADVRLVIAGEGPFGPALEKELEGLPAVFMGTLHGEELARLYASCDLLVFPSMHDTMGNAVLEAQASGLPVIVTDQGGASEHMAPGETGLVAEGGGSDALFAAMQRLVLDGNFREALSRGARAFAQQRDLHAITGQLLDMYAGETSTMDPADPRTAALFNVLDGARALAS
jgi:glycosyltransferase involved in cell wall biosynthesis